MRLGRRTALDVSHRSRPLRCLDIRKHERSFGQCGFGRQTIDGMGAYTFQVSEDYCLIRIRPRYLPTSVFHRELYVGSLPRVRCKIGHHDALRYVKARQWWRVW